MVEIRIALIYHPDCNTETWRTPINMAVESKDKLMQN
jgi:hypothetical protein